LTLETPDHQHGKEQESCLVIKEPWATPNRATPKSCYPFKKKLKNNFKKKKHSKKSIQEFKNKIETKKTKKTKKKFYLRKSLK
jgi:hypothetical protein